jgi:hypothetical protein
MYAVFAANLLPGLARDRRVAGWVVRKQEAIGGDKCGGRHANPEESK